MNVYRKVTRKIYDFSPEQEKNLLAVVWLYRGQTDKYLDLVAGYCRRTLDEAALCLKKKNPAGEAEEPLADYTAALVDLLVVIQPFLESLPEDGPQMEPLLELNKALPNFENDVALFAKDVAVQETLGKTQKTGNGELKKAVDRAKIEANDWSLTPGRYVGVAPEAEDEDFDFEETLREIHVELEDLNAEAVTLAATIKRNFEELGI